MDSKGNGLTLELPDGNEELLCFAEHNTSKPEGLELCVAAYTEAEEDVVYYASYNLREPYVKP